MTVERNRILVSSCVLGGPGEKLLPPRVSTENMSQVHALFTCSIYTLYLQEYAWPFFTQLPVPTDYTPPPGKALESKVFTCFAFSEM